MRDRPYNKFRLFDYKNYFEEDCVVEGGENGSDYKTLSDNHSHNQVKVHLSIFNIAHSVVGFEGWHCFPKTP